MWPRFLGDSSQSWKSAGASLVPNCHNLKWSRTNRCDTTISLQRSQRAPIYDRARIFVRGHRFTRLIFGSLSCSVSFQTIDGDLGARVQVPDLRSDTSMKEQILCSKLPFYGFVRLNWAKVASKQSSCHLDSSDVLRSLIGCSLSQGLE